jgi:hypothetical protein
MNAKPFLPSLLVLSLTLLAGAPALAAVDPFYQSLQRDAQLAFDRKDFPTAARTFRLACFGMLDEPRPLADCLARLALAQDGAGQVEAFRETFTRLAEVEDRFKGYSQGELPAELRAALEARLATRLPAATLAAAPAFRSTQGKKAAAPVTPSPQPVTPPAKSAAADPAPVKPSTAATKPAPAPPKAAAAAVTTPPAPAKPGPSTETAAARPLTDAERKKLADARDLLGAPRPSKELRQAFELARSVADAHPDSKDAQHLTAEGAYRISRWADAAAYFKRGGDPGDDEPERLFYMAVSLYESGDPPAAATTLRRALPNLKRTPYVETYIRKILGPP